MNYKKKILAHPAVESLEDEAGGYVHKAEMIWGKGATNDWWCHLKDGYVTSNNESSVHEATLEEVWDALQACYIPDGDQIKE